MTDGEPGATTRAAADMCTHWQPLWDPCSQSWTSTASWAVHMSTVKHSHLWTCRLRRRLGQVICHLTHFSSFWTPTGGWVMSEVTNSATTLSLPAEQEEGKFKLLPLQHLREEKASSWWEKEKRLFRQSRRANNALLNPDSQGMFKGLGRNEEIVSKKDASGSFKEVYWSRSSLDVSADMTASGRWGVSDTVDRVSNRKNKREKKRRRKTKKKTLCHCVSDINPRKLEFKNSCHWEICQSCICLLRELWVIDLVM